MFIGILIIYLIDPQFRGPVPVPEFESGAVLLTHWILVLSHHWMALPALLSVALYKLRPEPVLPDFSFLLHLMPYLLPVRFCALVLLVLPAPAAEPCLLLSEFC